MSRFMAAFAALFVTLSPAMAERQQPLTEPAMVLPDDLVIVDIRAEKDFLQGHIPGAVNAPYGAWRGPRENPGRVPDVSDLQVLFQQLGLAVNQSILVVHEGRNATDFGAAARVYWTLKSAGFEDLSILNGGYLGWLGAGGAPGTVARAVTPSDVKVSLASDWMMDAEGVMAVVRGTDDAVLLDARPADFFQGQTKHGAAQTAGTLEGALNLVHSTWFKADSPLMSAPEGLITEIRALAAQNAGVPLVSFCNTGHWAATNWFVASEIAGIADVKLYPESVVGWTLLGGPVTEGG